MVARSTSNETGGTFLTLCNLGPIHSRAAPQIYEPQSRQQGKPTELLQNDNRDFAWKTGSMQIPTLPAVVSSVVSSATLFWITAALFRIYAPNTVTARSKEWVCRRSLAGIAGLNSAGGTDVCHECFVLSGRGLCDGSIPHPEESYRVCVRVSLVISRATITFYTYNE